MIPKITTKDVILCKTKTEFDRIIKLFGLDPEFLNWDIYEKDTVLYIFKNQYGDLNGNASKKSLNIIKSETLS